MNLRTKQPRERPTLPAVMAKKATRSGSGRYDIREITLRVERMRVRCGLLQKEVAFSLGISESQFSHKAARAEDEASRSTFSIRELGLLADFFSDKTGRPLVGWPFVDESVSAIFDRAVQR